MSQFHTDADGLRIAGDRLPWDYLDYLHERVARGIEPTIRLVSPTNEEVIVSNDGLYVSDRLLEWDVLNDARRRQDERDCTIIAVAGRAEGDAAFLRELSDLLDSAGFPHLRHGRAIEVIGRGHAMSVARAMDFVERLSALSDRADAMDLEIMRDGEPYLMLETETQYANFDDEACAP